MCARLGPCPMKFRYLSEADLQRILASDSEEVTTVFENYFLVGYNPIRIIYQPPGETKRWVETYVGVTGNRLGDRLQSSVGLDTARLGKSSVPVVVIRMEETRSGHLNGGATRCVSIISVAKEPVLLLKAENYDENWRVTINEADTKDSSSSSTEDVEAGEDKEHYICQQSIEVRDRQIVIGQVRDENDKVVKPTIAALPAGKYQYQNGQLLRANR
ncbi:hypothetical protein [Hymenobacter radiodurans]|uniref:hypothetical protein n=1 Tax=Hymenobacter radiodurans TaxID=2496028 RepID=UPI001404B04C|nr:hypothetical protein [Hymenobacter radiodurans]